MCLIVKMPWAVYLEGGGPNIIQTLGRADHSRGLIPSCPAEERFLCRLLETDSVEGNENDGVVKYVGGALVLRHSSTLELIKPLEDTIDVQRVNTENIAQALHGNLSAEDVIIQFSKINDLMKKEANNLRGVVDAPHLKHKEYADVMTQKLVVAWNVMIPGRCRR